MITASLSLSTVQHRSVSDLQLSFFFFPYFFIFYFRLEIVTQKKQKFANKQYIFEQTLVTFSALE